MRWLLAGLFCIGFVCHSHAQDIKVNAKLDKSSILLGDQTVLRLSAEVPAKAPVSFPLLGDTLSAKVQIISVGKTDTVIDKNHPEVRQLSRAYTITSFDAGVQMVPSLVFQSGGKAYATEALPLEVKEVKVDTTKGYYDIKQPLTVTYTFMDWLRDEWPVLVAGIVALFVLLALWYYFRKIRKTKPAVAKPEVIVPAHVLALEQLTALRNKKLWQAGELKTYYSELTDILRSYLEKRYLINAQEQTSDEILSSLKTADISTEGSTALREILLLADLVKFAKA